MFVVRGLAVSISFFVLAYLCLSGLVGIVWRMLSRHLRSSLSEYSAGQLFAVRLGPAVIAASLTLFFVVPSFVLLEPRTTEEAIGMIPLLLGLVFFGFLGIGVRSAAVAIFRTSRLVNLWMCDATAVTGCSVPTFCTKNHAPALTVAGIAEPKVLMSDATASLLSEPELEVALRHELAHVRRRDNLKKLILHTISFPGMGALDEAWSDAAEMRADDCAVRNPVDALELASALIKLSRTASQQYPCILTTSLTSTSIGSLSARVERLLQWDRRKDRRSLVSWQVAIPSVILGFAALLLSYSAALNQIHELTELLIR